VRHIRVHDARHTYASLMLRRGVPTAYVSKQLGHSSIQVTVDLYVISKPVLTGITSKAWRLS
jgi:integrase